MFRWLSFCLGSEETVTYLLWSPSFSLKRSSAKYGNANCQLWKVRKWIWKLCVMSFMVTLHRADVISCNTYTSSKFCFCFLVHSASTTIWSLASLSPSYSRFSCLRISRYHDMTWQERENQRDSQALNTLTLLSSLRAVGYWNAMSEFNWVLLTLFLSSKSA